MVTFSLMASRVPVYRRGDRHRVEEDRDRSADEKGGQVHSEKMVEIHFKDSVPVAAGISSAGQKEVIGSCHQLLIIG